MMKIIQADIALPFPDLRTSAILLDVDGTLLDIAPTPDTVRVPPSLVGDIAHLSELTGGALAFVSGRRLVDIDRLFAPFKTSAVGCHGAEIRYGDGHTEHDAPLSEDMRDCFSQLGAGDNRLLVEDKAYSVALHYRRAPELEGTLKEAAQECLTKFPGSGLSLLNGQYVIELKRAGTSKGTGINALMAQPPFMGRRPVFAGDDRTDEDALAALPRFGGLGISVGRRLPGAQFELRRPGELRAWIAQLVESA